MCVYVRVCVGVGVCVCVGVGVYVDVCARAGMEEARILTLYN